MKASDTGQPIARVEEIAQGTLTTTDGRPVRAVSEYATGAQTADGRPIQAVSTTIDEGMPVAPISIYPAGTMKTADGRPVHAVSNYTAAGARTTFGGSPPPPPPPPPAAGATRTDFTSLGLTPALHYHPNTEATTVSNGRLTAVSANGTSPALTPSPSGPFEQTDLNGIKRWRFEGSEYLDVPKSFVATLRAHSVFIVGRLHETATTQNLFSLSYLSDGVTVFNGGNSLRSLRATGNVPWLYGVSLASFNSTVNKNYLPLGSQMQVFGMASRTTANGGFKTWTNKKPSSDLGQLGVTANAQGARIMGYLHSNGSNNFADIYEIVVFTTELTDVQAQGVADALVANWSIPEITQNLALEGDSITDGIGEVTSGDCLAMALTEPGRNLIPANVRVLPLGISGAKVAEAIARRDAANGWQAAKIGTNAADNIMAMQMGRNDTAAYITGGQTAAQAAQSTYDDIKAYWNDATNGAATVRGWKPVQMANITCDGGSTGVDLYGLIKANFAADVSGGSVIDLQAIQDSNGGLGAGYYPFNKDSAGRIPPYYQSADATHPSEYGTLIMATGGDTPQHGYGALA